MAPAAHCQPTSTALAAVGCYCRRRSRRCMCRCDSTLCCRRLERCPAVAGTSAGLQPGLTCAASGSGRESDGSVRQGRRLGGLAGSAVCRRTGWGVGTCGRGDGVSKARWVRVEPAGALLTSPDLHGGPCADQAPHRHHRNTFSSDPAAPRQGGHRPSSLPPQCWPGRCSSCGSGPAHWWGHQHGAGWPLQQATLAAAAAAAARAPPPPASSRPPTPSSLRRPRRAARSSPWSTSSL